MDRTIPVRVGIAGVGKIACEQHIPAIRGNPFFEIRACTHCTGALDAIPNHSSVEAMLAAHPELDAVAVCSPPQARYEVAKAALLHGKHVLLEKPPCPSVEQLEELIHLAQEQGRTIYQTWHARHAAGVDAAQAWLSARRIQSGRVVWKEDVQRWHPGQSWLWRSGGFGVFDAGINALSILTEITAEPISVKSAELFVPSNCETPVAANVILVTAQGAQIAAEFDFRHAGQTAWDIHLETDHGTLALEAYGSNLLIDGVRVPTAARDGEYPCVYRHFADLIRDGRSEVDKTPLKLVSEIFKVGRQVAVEAFDKPGFPAGHDV